MIVSGNQPYFIPYLGYWQLIRQADVFLIGDDYSYSRQSWVKRNRILYHGEPKLFGINIKNVSFQTISEVEISSVSAPGKMALLYDAYKNAPYYSVGAELMKEILSIQTSSLLEFLMHSIRVICEYLAIDTPIKLTSSFEGNNKLKSDERIYDYCHRLSADTYVNPIGGMEIYSVEKFKERGITLQFLKSKLPEYRQFGNEFVPGLSIIDIIMFNSREDCIRMLDDYVLIDENNSLE